MNWRDRKMASVALKCPIQGHLLLSLYNLSVSATHCHLQARTCKSSSLDCMLAISIRVPRHLTPNMPKAILLILTSSANILFFLQSCLCGAVRTNWSLEWKTRSLQVDLSPVSTGLSLRGKSTLQVKRCLGRGSENRNQQEELEYILLHFCSFSNHK